MKMVTNDILEYLSKNSSPESGILKELRRETHLKTVYPQMLSGPVQGKLLEFISRMIKPGNILEIGTFTGYSAICLEKGLKAGGKLHTIEINPEMAGFASRYFKKAGIEKRVILHLGDALELIPEINESFDLVFIDAGKEHYSDYFELVADKINPGGYLLTDNVLWSGKVLLPEPQMDRETKGIAQYNSKLVNDARMEVVMLPVRDGLSIARKL
jgi:predicted O-methyltransferase YrrM